MSTHELASQNRGTVVRIQLHSKTKKRFKLDYTHHKKAHKHAATEGKCWFIFGIIQGKGRVTVQVHFKGTGNVYV